MNKVLKSSLIAAAICVLCGYAAFATSTITETQTPWYSVDFANLTMADLSVSPWTAPTSGTATVEDGAIVLKGAETLVYTPSTGTSEKFLRQKFTIAFSPYYEEDLPDTALFANAQAVLLCYTNGTENAWFSYDGSSLYALSGHTPVTNTAYEFLVDLDYSTGKVSFRVREAGSNGSYTQLTKGTDSWIANIKSAATSIADLKFYGNTTLSALCASNVTTTATIDDAPAVKVSESWIVEHGGADPRTSPESAATFMAADGSNGMPRWQSFVLGLDPQVANDKPLVKSVQNSEAGRLSFQLTSGGSSTIAVNADAGVAVKYRVNTYSDAAGTSKTVTGTDTDIGNTVVIDAPTSGDKAKYYRIEIDFDDQM